VPLWDKGIVKVYRVSNDDREAFRKMLKKLRQFLEETTKGVPVEEQARIAADSFVLFIRTPLIRDILETSITPSKVASLLLCLREVAEKIRELENPYFFAKSVIELLKELRQSPVAQSLLDRETADLVERFWLVFPSDTRPGYNTSSLAAHLLMTSAIAYTLHRGSEKDLHELRLASLLHDLGKVFEPERHVDASVELAETILKGIIDDKIIENVKEMIRSHHKEGSPIKEADSLAAASDRLDWLVSSTIGGELGKITEILNCKWKEWECWKVAYERVEELKEKNIVKEDPIKELTEKFLDKVPKILDDISKRKKVKEVEEKVKEELQLVFIDFEGIQNLIFRSQEVRALSAASYIVDFVVHAHLIFYLRKKGLKIPPEAVIYSGGGDILLLLPKESLKELRDKVREYSNKTGFNMIIASIPFKSSYFEAISQLQAEIMKERFFTNPIHEVKLKEMDYPCELCYSEPAEYQVSTIEGMKSICRTCRDLYDFGSNVHFRSKWESKINVAGHSFSAEEVFKKKYDEIGKYIVELIAGHDAEELERGTTQRDLAVIKMDGNLINSFMLESISFTDGIERSFRIDIALKKAYISALDALYRSLSREAGEDEARKACAQVYLGTVYAGGDDSLILAPSWLALPFVSLLSEEFTRQLGLSRGISAGIAVGPARMSIWSLVDCAIALLEESKKAIHHEDLLNSCAISFDVIESGSPSGSTAKERLQELRSKKISEQPFIISAYCVANGYEHKLWEVLLNGVLLSQRQEINSVESSIQAYEQAFLHGYLASRSVKKGSLSELIEKVDGRLTGMRKAVLDTLHAAGGTAAEEANEPYLAEKSLLFVARQLRRGDILKGHVLEAYKKLFEILRSAYLDNKVFPAADILRFIKMCKGGV
jgi:HD superfamily phosphodiesterase